MSRINRRLLDFAIGMAVYLALAYAGAGWWALLVFPYGLWCFYDGFTRPYLR